MPLKRNAMPLKRNAMPLAEHNNDGFGRNAIPTAGRGLDALGRNAMPLAERNIDGFGRNAIPMPGCGLDAPGAERYATETERYATGGTQQRRLRAERYTDARAWLRWPLRNAMPLVLVAARSAAAGPWCSPR